ncbi:MAG TPA: SRPBCC family protein [Pyrinomonadaceae bacterium]|jgi:choline monooxygenase|nr:SRPBCC family protein [Pyrinomonadaceae bacterium]
MSIFEIDADIRRARTLHSDFYTDERYFNESREKIFARSWQFVGREWDLEHAITPATILPGMLDEPVLLVKTSEWLSCLTNVCTHRGKVLVDAPCEGDLIRCPYHGRRFLLDGKFASMPEFEGVENFPSESDNLLRVSFAVRQGFMFASIDPVEAFDTFVSDVAERFSDDNYEPATLRLTSTREYKIDAHWALYCENYLEGFHIPYVHHGLNKVVEYGTYSTELFRYSSLQTGYNAAGEIEARYLFIFPNLMFNFYSWGISVNVVRPIAPDKTVVEFLTYVRDEAEIDGGAGADLHTVELEDETVVESVQKGIRSRFYSQGRYSPSREQGTHHFHRLIAEFMSK